MRNRICGMCNCGKLHPLPGSNWFECANCEEIFELDDCGEFNIVDYEAWANQIYGLQKNNMFIIFS